MESIIKLITPTLLTLSVGLFAWIIRKIYKIEGQVQTHDKEIDTLKENQKEEIKDIKFKIDKMSDKLTELCVSFGELAGYMKGKECKDERSHP
jgi:hypothetical protein